VLETHDGAVVADPNRGFGCIACAHCMMVCPTEAIAVQGRELERAALVPVPSRESNATPDQLESLMVSRRSVRRFKPDEVPRQALDRVIDAAATAPMGIPPWNVGIVAFYGRERVRELAEDTATPYRGLLRIMDNAVARRLMRTFSKRQTSQQMEGFILPLGRDIVAAHRNGGDKVLYDAPAALLFHTSPYADESDAAIACTYAMLTAEAAGLGTTMIGCASPALARRKPLLARYGLPPGNLPRIILILGYPAVHFHRAIRRQFATVTYYGA
jgi:nitroreductase